MDASELAALDEAQGPAMQDDIEIDFNFDELREKVRTRKLQPVARLNDLHEALADYMLVNPGATYREMGAHFGYSSVAWLCTVVRSDMFQAYFAKRRQEVGVFIAASLPKKLEAAAHLAVEKVITVLEKTEDAELILDSFDKILHRYGYAPNAKGGAQTGMQQQGNIQNNFYLAKAEFEEARGQLLEGHKAKEGEDGDNKLLPAPAT